MTFVQYFSENVFENDLTNLFGYTSRKYRLEIMLLGGFIEEFFGKCGGNGSRNFRQSFIDIFNTISIQISVTVFPKIIPKVFSKVISKTRIQKPL